MRDILQTYKELIRQYDALERSNQDNEHILDQLDSMWYKLTDEEKKEVTEFSIYLHQQWPPEKLYEEACEVVRSIQSTIPASPNDITPLSVRLKQLAYWENKKDEAGLKIQKDSIDGASHTSQ